MKTNIKYIIVAILSTIFLLSCDKNVSPTIVNENVPWINGKIEGLKNEQGLKIVLGEINRSSFLGSSEISSNGEFSIIPELPHNSDLFEIIYQETYMDTSVIYVSRPNIKGLQCLLRVNNSQENTIGYVFEEKGIKNQKGYNSVAYVFVEDSLTISGTVQYHSESIKTLEIIYNLKYQKGWNKKVTKNIEIVGEEGNLDLLKIEFTTEGYESGKYNYYEN